MKALGPDARAVIDAARGAGEPDRAARARVRSAVVRRAGAAAALSTGLSATLKAAASGIGGLTAKGIFAVAIAMTAAGGAYVLRARDATIASARLNEPSAPKPRALETSTASAREVSPPLPSATPLSVAERKRSDPRLAPVAKKVPPLDAPSSLAPDVARLREARAALNGGNASRALELLDGVTTGGPLAEEREGLRAIAQCMLDPAARGAAERFIEAWPTSPLRARVGAACGSR